MISARTWFVILCFTLISLSCKSIDEHNVEVRYGDYSNYYRLISKADSLFFEERYEKAYKLFKNVFSKVEPIRSYRFNEYYVYLISKHYANKVVEKSEIEKLISKFGVKKGTFLRNEIMQKYFESYIDDNHYDCLITIYEKSIAFDLRKSIASMLAKDQYYRTEYEFDCNVNEAEKFKKIKEIDAVNESRLIAFFDKGIYPDAKTVGNLYYDEDVPNIEILLLHTKDSIRLNYFLPKLKQFIKQGKANPYVYGMLVDQYELYNDREQKYGTYNISKISPEQAKRYNKNRKKLNIGFPSVEFDFWSYKIKTNSKKRLYINH